MSSAIVLATTAENAEALLSGERDRDHRRFPPKQLPARAYPHVLRRFATVFCRHTMQRHLPPGHVSYCFNSGRKGLRTGHANRSNS